MDFRSLLSSLLKDPGQVIGFVGSILIAAGLLKFFGMNIPINGGGLEIAVAGWLMKQI